MADTPTKSGAVLSWAGGIAATVIASVIIYYVTRPPVPPPPVPVTQVGLNGFVEDSVSQKPVTNAKVTAALGATLASQTTDSEGRYAFIMDSTAPPSQSISVNVLVDGYAYYSAAVPITSGNNFAELPLQPNPTQVAALHAGQQAAAAQPGQPVAPIQLAPRPALILHVPKNYAVRADATALRPKS